MTKNTGVRRLVSLDAFRGFTIAAMIIVNTPGSWEHVYAPLRHASWHGVTPTDCIFPFFIFIVGISITLSYRKMLDTGRPKAALVAKTLKRAALIFLIGIFLGLFPDFAFDEIRIPGVLQRIAVVFLVCALLYLYTSWKQQAIIGGALLLLYWAAMLLVPVPGVGTGVLEPGKNLAAWVDGLLIPGTMWQGTWDPEGILSTLPAIVSGILGMLAGRLLAIEGMPHERKVIWLYVGGLSAFLLGSAWGWVFPINKNLWTSSYVLYTAGLAAMIFASLFFVMEVLKFSAWAKVGVVFGANAITAYVIGGLLPEVLGPLNTWYARQFISGDWAEVASLLWAIGVCLLCFIPIYVLYKKRIFIKI
ncbi:acyltransferase family protein [Parapedobacter sp. 10938]|uniref:acyltransferase family protein n=1 Tax=Parapedobacter flavus TaxID=3110225 RepID=UPI002DB980CC|nr:heparan-alpha-glucosaminide N-acetyltransferase domain-containing protein [Parapedobacter sp. 10938]MEC3881973.1 heparan-alpha-glucosaminide N-acetyltransferase domain-containing protein [Parapedobacter sp. 10938]